MIRAGRTSGSVARYPPMKVYIYSIPRLVWRSLRPMVTRPGVYLPHFSSVCPLFPLLFSLSSPLLSTLISFSGLIGLF